MSKVKVWNRNTYPHREQYQGEWIEIPAGGYVEMDYFDGINFQGQCTGIPRLGDDTPDPRGFKMIYVDKPTEPIFKDLSLVNHANGYQAATKEDLAAMEARFAHLRVVDPTAEREIPQQSGPSYNELLARLTALEDAAANRKKPGPKPKLFGKGGGAA